MTHVRMSPLVEYLLFLTPSMPVVCPNHTCTGCSITISERIIRCLGQRFELRRALRGQKDVKDEWGAGKGESDEDHLLYMKTVAEDVVIAILRREII